jgi:cyanate permease
MVAGALMHLAGYLLLAVSAQIAVHLLAYALLIGPALALTATVLPPALVARWYVAGRGRAIGLATMPIGTALVPLLMAMSLKSLGISGAYLVLAAGMALLVVPLLFIVDRPPWRTGDDGGAETSEPAGLSIPQLLARPGFWFVAIGWGAVSMSGTVGAAHLVPMTRGWGFSTTQAASLISLLSFSAMGGTLVFGWLAERLQGALLLSLLCLGSALCWGLVSLAPAYPPMLLLAALLGLFGGGVIPVFAMALLQTLGRSSFERAFGLGHLLGLPFNLLSVPAVAAAYTLTGSYSAPIAGLMVLLLLIALLAAIVAKGAGARASVQA